MKLALRLVLAMALVALVTEPGLAVEYRRYKLHELVRQARTIVAGEVVSLGPEAFTVQVDQLVDGRPVDSRFSVRRFRDWTCARRWTSYRTGQRVLLFLDGKRRILGAGGEGEMPRVEDDVVLRGYRVRGVESRLHELGEGATARGSRIAWPELVEGLRAYRALDEVGTPEDLAARGAELAATSRFARHLWEEQHSSGAREEAPPCEPPADGEPLTRIDPVEHGFSGVRRMAPGTEDPHGFRQRSWFGDSATFIGDLDGNGVQDLAVGASRDSLTGHFHGALWILRMDADGSILASTEISDGQNGVGARMHEFAQFGGSVTSLGDLDGDGVHELAVGAEHWNGSAWRQGGVWVLFLDRDAVVRRAVELAGQDVMQRAGVGSHEHVGKALASLGDLDGDGLVELAVGQSPSSLSRPRDRGRSVWIASVGNQGRAHRVRRLHNLEDGFTDASSWFGDGLAAVGDVDGDGIDDLAVSDPYDDDGGNLRGAAWIVFLRRDASLREATKISDWEGGFEGLLRDHDSFGRSLGAPGDLDGDGVPDLLVGARHGLWVLYLERDGTVREQHEVAPGRLGFTDDASSLGHSVACGAREGDVLPFVLGGTSDDREHVLWLLELGPDPTITGWRYGR